MCCAAASKPGPMVWDENCRLGDPVVDEQHILLCSIANRLLDHPQTTLQHEAVSEIVSELGRFLLLHFDTEEALMRRIGMPEEEYLKHHEAHLRIVEQYAHLNLEAMQGRHHTATDLFAQFRQWVVDHLHLDDLKLRDYIAKAG